MSCSTVRSQALLKQNNSSIPQRPSDPAIAAAGAPKRREVNAIGKKSSCSRPARYIVLPNKLTFSGARSGPPNCQTGPMSRHRPCSRSRNCCARPVLSKTRKTSRACPDAPSRCPPGRHEIGDACGRDPHATYDQYQRRRLNTRVMQSPRQQQCDQHKRKRGDQREVVDHAARLHRESRSSARKARRNPIANRGM